MKNKETKLVKCKRCKRETKHAQKDGIYVCIVCELPPMTVTELLIPKIIPSFFLAVFLCAVAVGYYKYKNSPERLKKLAEEKVRVQKEKEKLNAEKDLRAKRYVVMHAAKEKVSSLLKDPDSVNFKDVFYVPIGTQGFACGYFNAKNSFGAYSGYQRFIGNTIAVMVENSNANFDKNWSNLCE